MAATSLAKFGRCAKNGPNYNQIKNFTGAEFRTHAHAMRFVSRAFSIVLSRVLGFTMTLARRLVVGARQLVAPRRSLGVARVFEAYVDSAKRGATPPTEAIKAMDKAAVARIGESEWNQASGVQRAWLFAYRYHPLRIRVPVAYVDISNVVIEVEDAVAIGKVLATSTPNTCNAESIIIGNGLVQVSQISVAEQDFLFIFVF